MTSVIDHDLRWHPMGQPPVLEKGEEIRVLVAYRSKARDHASSGEMYYLNGFTLDWEDDGPCAMTGWFDRYEDVDGSATYRRLSDEFITHLGWTNMPTMPDIAGPHVVTARCGDDECGHVWIVAYLPMQLDKAARLMHLAACPKCANESPLVSHD